MLKPNYLVTVSNDDIEEGEISSHLLTEPAGRSRETVHMKRLQHGNPHKTH
jgi:hypothetical protein